MIQTVPPRKLTWIPKKLPYLKRKFIFQLIILGIQPLVFGGGIFIFTLNGSTWDNTQRY